MGVNGEALQLHTVYEKPYFFYYKSHENLYQYYKSCENLYQYYKSHENPYQVLQVTRTASEHAMKLKVRMIKSLSPQYQAIPEKHHSFVAVGIVTCDVLCTHNNTNGNKFMIFSGIAWCYGDTYISSNLT